MKIQTTKTLALALMFFVFVTAAVPTSATYSNGFETDLDGWSDFGGTVTRTASGAGALGVTSADGSYHAEVALGPNAGNGGFTNFGGYGYVWPGQILQSLDVYIDPSAGAIGDGWYLDNAVNDNLNDSSGIASASSDWREAGGVGALKATDGNWWITADADGASYQGPPEGGVGLQITQAGWYTIVSDWVANPDGLTVDRNTYIYDDQGNELYSSINAQQVPLTGAYPIGGTRYGWLAATDGTTLTLAIDNSSLAVPEPTSAALLALTSLGFLRRRR